MARSLVPNWAVCRVIAHVHGHGHLNPIYLAEQLDIEPEDVIELAEEAAPFVGYLPTLYRSDWVH